ncbi:hypothetical protein ES705_28989 [subsurface metagenome]
MIRVFFAWVILFAVCLVSMMFIERVDLLKGLSSPVNPWATK